jgi:hypothetical protein
LFEGLEEEIATFRSFLDGKPKTSGKLGISFGKT